ncbi:MAG: glycosyltransferase family 2 protein [Chlamydiales bacterium]
MVQLSFIVPNYNYAQFLEQAIDSLFCSYCDFEVLIFDDASTDNSVAVIEKLCVKYTAIRFFSTKKNLGPAGAMNMLIPHIRGKYVAFLGSDDYMIPQAVERVFVYLRQFPDAELYCSDDVFFTKADPSPLLQVRPLLDTPSCRFSPSQVYILFSHTDFSIPGHTVVVRTDIFRQYAPFNDNIGSICDWWIVHQIAFRYGLVYMHEQLVAQRKHALSYGGSAPITKKREMWFQLLRLLEKDEKRYRLIITSGVFRQFGLRAIYRDLIKRPRYWKYLFPMCRKILEKSLAKFVGIDREKYWLKRI